MSKQRFSPAIRTLAIAGSVVTILIIARRATADGDFRTVVVSGRPVQGLPPGLEYAQLQSPPQYRALNNAGQVIFAGDLAGATPANDFAMWFQDASGNTRFVAREGDPAPGLQAGLSFDGGLFYPVINGAGDVAFFGAGVAPGVEIGGIWAERNGALQLAAGKGQPAPGLPGKTIAGGPPLTSFGDGGHLAFVAHVELSPSFILGLWSEGGGNGPELLGVTGGPVPGVPGASFSLFSYPAINKAGRTAFLADFTGPGINPVNDTGLWAGTNAGNLDRLVRQGDEWPGLADSTFSFIGVNSAPQINSRGDVAFAANLHAPSINETSGIWLANDSGLHEVIRHDTAVPNLPNPNIAFAGIGHPLLDDDGQVAFAAFLTSSDGTVNDSNNESIWSNAIDGTLHMVAREGDTAPGGAVGETFTQLQSPLINKFGQVAFLTGLAHPGGLGSGIFAQDRNGTLHKIIASGDMIDVDDSSNVDLRTVAGVAFGGWGNTSSGLPGDFNDRGQVLFVADFTDGHTGLFISNLVAVPEPVSGALLAPLLASCAPCLRRERHARNNSVSR